MSELGASLVVGTAGHIDHGKTSLVRLLTGKDLDTLPEEKERGITIALGFTALDLPDGRRVAFVDVPGHERLVRTMVAGATGMDAVLLCISAQDGAMPQTREHLGILGLLGLRVGAVVLTKADLVDEELLALAVEDAKDLVRGTFLEGAPVLTVSSVTGQGRDELVALLAGFTRPPRRVSGPFRLPVDRAFVRAGFGTVVTGTCWSGKLEDGEQVLLLPQRRSVRVRGIQVHGAAAGHAEAGWRTALNLAAVEKEEVPRGTVVVRGEVPCTSMIDVRYRHLTTADPVEEDLEVRLLLGTSECTGRLHFAEERDMLLPGEITWAQLRLEAPVVALPGDRFVLRRPSPAETLGGGEVIDPWAPRLRRKDRERAARQLEALAAGNMVVWLERAAEDGISEAAWRDRAPGHRGGVVLGDRRFAAPVVARLQGAVLEQLESWHREQPLALGANRRQLHQGRLQHLSEKVFDDLLAGLARDGLVALDGALARLPGFQVNKSADQVDLERRIYELVAATGLEGLKAKELHEKLPASEVAALVHLMETEAVLVAVAGLGWVAAPQLAELREHVGRWFKAHDRLTPASFKELTGLSRRAAIPLLEWLDGQKLTKRLGDERVKGPAL